MATWLTYLRIAENLKTRIAGIELPYLMLGFVAPFLDNHKEGDLEIEDLIAYSKGYIGFGNISLDEKVFSFKKRYLDPPLIIYKSDSKRSFLWGYYFNLLVTQLWLQMFGQLDDIESFIRANDIYDFEYLSNNAYGTIETFDKSEIDTKRCESSNVLQLTQYKNKIVKYYYTNKSIINSDNIKDFKADMIEEFIKKAENLCVNFLLGKA